MRVCYILLAATAAFLANSVVISANPVQTGKVKGDNSRKRHLRSQNILSWPEELEEFVEHHHHIREIFTRWCLEDHEPTDRLEDTREKRDPTMSAAYKKYMAAKGLHDRKLTVVECNV
ncbi:hypothetical protein PHYPSEUDO_011288 [Phytophthora pseudosyringae]|uniref:RxLR effector protein n=1 Tax=Phytophthora pseudosyringae TaxID=221518 RepID=A0A8T1WMR8_9STRA|nr:hypothetical protein PHYPSEUDO_011288 [Phytophthora pseudosyringae]